jgi:hypothetical protein
MRIGTGNVSDFKMIIIASHTNKLEGYQAKLMPPSLHFCCVYRIVMLSELPLKSEDRKRLL